MKLHDEHFDVVIVGAGIYGLSLADNMSAKGLRILLLDDGGYLDRTNGSSGETRLFRRTTVESSQYIQHAEETLSYLHSLQRTTDTLLYEQTGFLMIANNDTRSQNHHGVVDIIGKAAIMAKTHGITYELFDGQTLMHRWPRFAIDKTAAVFYEQDALTLFVDDIHDAIVNHLLMRDVRLLLRCSVDQFMTTSHGIKIMTLLGDFYAQKLVFATGTGEIDHFKKIKPLPQPTIYFHDASNETMPAFVCTTRERPLLFGFPHIADRTTGIKIVAENMSPDLISYDAVAEASRTLIKDLGEILHMENRYYAYENDSRIHVRDLGSDIISISGCSGYGYKLAAGITAQLASRIVKSIKPYKV